MDVTDQDRKLVRSAALFGDLSEETLARLLSAGLVFRYPRGVVLFEQGEQPGYLHVVLEGEIGMTGMRAGEETVVEILQPGEMFLAAAVFTDKPYLMGAKVLAPARLLLLPGDELRRQIRDTPELCFAMLTSVARHFRLLVREVKDLKLKTSAQRLAAYLLALADGQEFGRYQARLPHAKGIIAARIGVRPETLSRHFNLLRAVGVSVQGSDVLIRDVARLAAFCRDATDQEIVW